MVAQWFDTSAFQAPGVGNFGSGPRNEPNGPGFIGIDVSVHKVFRLTERAKLMFRSDCYNLPNRPNFSNPNVTRGSGSFGRITGVIGTGRLIQVSMRLEF